MTELFYKLPQDIAARRDLLPSDKLVFAVVNDCFNGKAVCWPGKRYLMERTGLADKTVCDSIERLHKAGVLVVDRRGNGKSHHYKLPIETGSETKPVQRANRFKDYARGGSGSEPEPVQGVNPNQTDLLNQTNNVRFSAFWEMFRELSPSPVGSKKEAEAQWSKAVKADTPENIIDGLKRFSNHHRRQVEAGGFAPNWKHCVRWLKAEQWKDVQAETETPPPPATNPEDTPAARRIREQARQQFLREAQ